MSKKLIKKRLRKANFFGRVIASMPFVRCVILNGSLASKNHKYSSDIDLLIITKPGRIFTSRFFINLFAIVFRIKRPKDELKPHAGKFCFNYFLTENFLKIPIGRGRKIDRYCADNYSKSFYISGGYDLYLKFLNTNKGLFDKYGFKTENIEIKTSSINPKMIQIFLEFLLNDRFEQCIKNYQIKKIRSDSRTDKYPDLIVYNDNELRFHPPATKND